MDKAVESHALYGIHEGVYPDANLSHGSLLDRGISPLLESRVLDMENVKPIICCRNVDDTFVVVRNLDHLIQLKTAMESN